MNGVHAALSFDPDRNHQPDEVAPRPVEVTFGKADATAIQGGLGHPTRYSQLMLAGVTAGSRLS